MYVCVCVCVCITKETNLSLSFTPIPSIPRKVLFKHCGVALFAIVNADI